MPNKWVKYIFFILSALMLVIMLWTSRDAGISGDEEVHYNQSEMVYRYFATLGTDKASLDTPSTHLQYYGQAFDNLVTILVHWFSIDDIYSFRHVMCTLAAWLTIFITAWFAVYLSGYAGGIITLLLFFISPTFLGHAHNNLKDIPFALAYIAALYFMVRVVFSNDKASRASLVMLTCSIALAVGIRPGGLILIAYLLFFSMLEMSFRYVLQNQGDWKLFKKVAIRITVVSLLAYLLGLLLWPYALQNPVVNPWKSYQVMTHFPTTIRQIFEGKLYWSDLLPWYYLPKTMLITIPVVVWIGLATFFVLAAKFMKKTSVVLYAFLLFAILFPPLFAILKDANLYGSWRHFLFIYPGIVLLAALGFAWLFQLKKHYIINWGLAVLLVVFMVHPLRFMIKNHPYYYLYYNQLTGGLQKAYGNYETDYYYHSMREGTEWLLQNLNDNGVQEAVVGANFSVAWYLRHHSGLKFRYFAWDNRCETDWDYAVVGNSYISPYQLKKGLWPPKNAIHTVYVDNVPVCAVLKRSSKADMEGIRALKMGKATEAVQKLKDAVQIDSLNEVVYYYLAAALKKTGNVKASDSILHQSLKIHPQYELSLLMLGRNAEERGDFSEAASYYERLIAANAKYYLAYVLRAKLYSESELEKARKTLKACLKIYSKYKPAILALADTYRKTDPGIAEKYDNLAKSIK